MTETQPQPRNGLPSARILIVEDEFYLADDLARALLDAGAEVVGPIAFLREAEEAVAVGDFNCVVLDMNLHGETAFSIAEKLDRQGTPLLIVTGYNGASLPAEMAHIPRIQKPADSVDIVEALRSLLGRS